MFKVNHISFSNTGGAGVVAQRLCNYQNTLPDYESTFLYDFNGNILNNKFKNLSLTSRVIIDNKIIKKYNQNVLFSLFRNIENRKFMNIADSYNGVTHLHWINGLIDFKSLSKLTRMRKKLVWTLHDMEPFTGGCHQSLGCSQLESGCTKCPIVYPKFRDSVRNQFNRKKLFFESQSSMCCVFPTHWMLNQFNSAIRKSEVETYVIPNPISTVFFSDKVSRAFLVNSPNQLVVGFVSNSLSDKFKRLDLTIEILREVSQNLKIEVTLIALGSPIRITANYSNIKIIQPGFISDENTMANFYASMDLLISTSKSESFGLSIAEAGASGIPSIILLGSGSSENVIDGFSCLTAKNKSELIYKIMEFTTNVNLRKKLSENIRNHAKKYWHVEKVNSRYEQVYSKFTIS